MTSEEIHATEQDEAKKTIAIAKAIKQGRSAASVRTEYNVSDSDIISRLATASKQLHEILDAEGLVSPMPLIGKLSKVLTQFQQDTETQTQMMAHDRRGAGLAMSQAVERTHREQDIQGELMRFEQYGIQPDKSKLYP